LPVNTVGINREDNNYDYDVWCYMTVKKPYTTSNTRASFYKLACS